MLATLKCTNGNESRAQANAVTSWAQLLERPTLRRLGGMRKLVERFGLDLAGLLNRLRRDELDSLAGSLGVACDGTIGSLRARLWLVGAEIEAGGIFHLGSAVQPAPIVLGERLQFQAPVHGTMPDAPRWPRPIPPPRAMVKAQCEPNSTKELLARADSLIGVRLGLRGRDKGRYGSLVAELLGVVEDGKSEPDWRGIVELKTLPVIIDRSGLWRVKEDPAIAMEGAAPHKKLASVLWIARASAVASSPILSWYFQERDAVIERLIARDLHTRPKGPRGAWSKGWYLRKRFFLDSGLLASLNG